MVRMAQNTTVRSQDRRDFEKFIKNFVQKAAQVIIQSRLGEKVSIPCKTKPSSTDWFNLAVPDLPDVLAETRKALNGEMITHRLPITVEISLQTAEGDQMVLEYWSLNLDQNKLCPLSDRILLIVYNRMGILLKSLVSETRLKPAYGLSRTQGSDSYVFCYRVFAEDGPQMHMLGEGCVQKDVGQIATPVGTVQLSVAYRTKMLITPTQTGRDNSIMLKSDHFNSNSPRHNIGDDQNGTMCTRLKLGAFADTAKTRLQEPVLIIPRVPFPKLLAERNSANIETPPAENPDPLMERLMHQGVGTTTTILKNKQQDISNGNSPPTTTSNDSCQHISNGVNRNAKHLRNEEVTTEEVVLPLKNGKTKNRYTLTPTNDDFMMVDLNTPFATSNCCTTTTNNEQSSTDSTAHGTDSELGKIYREWKQAPPLCIFKNLPQLNEQMLDLTKQLELFETDMKQYEDVVQSLCQSPGNE